MSPAAGSTTYPSYVLRSSRLEVEIAEPGTLYRRERFDWSGFITQITLDRKHTICVPEAVDGRGCGGYGLCNEFAMLTAVGYEQALPGQLFTKPGVGLMPRRNLRHYFFSQPLPIKRFNLVTQCSDHSVTLIHEPLECRGYALRTQKTICVRDNTLTIDYEAENTGSLPIQMDEYCHNFIAVNQRKTGPELTLTLPFKLEPFVITQGHFDFAGPAMYWPKTPDSVSHAIFHQPSNCSESWWQMHDEQSGVSIQELNDFRWQRFAVWVTPRVVSPEAFIMVNLLPGQVQHWQRKWIFNTH